MKRAGNLLLVFVKNPVLGKVKTRLAKSIGDKAALEIYLKLLAHTQSILQSINCADTAVFYSDEIEKQYFKTAKYKNIQTGNDLGERMYRAFEWGFDLHYKNIVIIGSDCFEIQPQHIIEAFDNLQKNDIVIGPANDGGYYLLGMKNLEKSLFENIDWSTESVYVKTINKLKKLKKTFVALEKLNDVDTIEDLK